MPLRVVKQMKTIPEEDRRIMRLRPFCTKMTPIGTFCPPVRTAAQNMPRIRLEQRIIHSICRIHLRILKKRIFLIIKSIFSNIERDLLPKSRRWALLEFTH